MLLSKVFPFFGAGGSEWHTAALKRILFKLWNLVFAELQCLTRCSKVKAYSRCIFSHVSWASCPLKLQKYLLSSSGPMHVCDVFWLRSPVWCNVRTWDYFECYAGVSQEIVQGVFLMIILSPELRLHTHSSSIDVTLSTHFVFWIPAVSCWDLLDWMKRY